MPVPSDADVEKLLEVVAAERVATQATKPLMGSAFKAVAPFLKAVPPFLKGAAGNALFMGAEGVYQISKEDGIKHKEERAAGVATTITATLGADAILTSGAISSAVATTGIATGAAVVGTAAILAPVAVAVGTYVAVENGANKIIDTNRQYESIDHTFTPSKDYQNIKDVEGLLTKRMQELGATKGANGKFDLTNSANVEKLQQAIDEKKTELKTAMNENNPMLPRWIQFTDAQSDKRGKFEDAKQEFRRFESAAEELPGYLSEVKNHEQKKAQMMALSKDGAHGAIKNVLPASSADTHEKAPIAAVVPSDKSTRSI